MTQQKDWHESLLKEMLYDMFYQDSIIKEKIPQFEADVLKGKKSVSSSAMELVQLFKDKHF